jgi:pimeloyl-ACP methyl ester carboxylesterase
MPWRHHRDRAHSNRPPGTAICDREHDGCIDQLAGANMHELFANSLDRRRVPGVGHFLHLERPDEINGTIAAYLRNR